MCKKLIIAGRGVRIANAMYELKYVSWFTKIPIATTILGKDIIATEDSIGSIGIKGTVNIYDYDELIFLGCSMPIAQLGYEYKKLNKKKILVVNIERPTDKIRYEFRQKDCKEWLREILSRHYLID